jgi:hypothetical protein
VIEVLLLLFGMRQDGCVYRKSKSERTGGRMVVTITLGDAGESNEDLAAAADRLLSGFSFDHRFVFRTEEALDDRTHRILLRRRLAFRLVFGRACRRLAAHSRKDRGLAARCCSG